MSSSTTSAMTKSVFHITGLSPLQGLVIGVAVGLLASCLQAIGLSLQRKSHVTEERKLSPSEQRSSFKRRRWLVGISIFVVASAVGNVVQLTDVPLPVLIVLQMSVLIFNVIAATYILPEAITRVHALGIALVLIGGLLVITYGAINEPSHTQADLVSYFTHNAAFITWLVLTFIFIGTTLLGIRFLRALVSTRIQTLSAKRTHVRETTSPQANGGDRESGLPTRVVSEIESKDVVGCGLELSYGLLYGLISGIYAAHALHFAKSAVQLISRCGGDEGVGDSSGLTHSQGWALMLFLGVLFILQVYYMHCGLKLCSPTVLYPVAFCTYKIVAIIDSVIYLHHDNESHMSFLAAVLVVIGTVVLLAGVVLLCLTLLFDSSSLVVTTSHQDQDGGVRRSVSSIVDEESPLLYTNVNPPETTEAPSYSGPVWEAIPAPSEPDMVFGNHGDHQTPHTQASSVPSDAPPKRTKSQQSDRSSASSTSSSSSSSSNDSKDGSHLPAASDSLPPIERTKTRSSAARDSDDLSKVETPRSNDGDDESSMIMTNKVRKEVPVDQSSNLSSSMGTEAEQDSSRIGLLESNKSDVAQATLRRTAHFTTTKMVDSDEQLVQHQEQRQEKRPSSLHISTTVDDNNNSIAETQDKSNVSKPATPATVAEPSEYRYRPMTDQSMVVPTAQHRQSIDVVNPSVTTTTTENTYGQTTNATLTSTSTVTTTASNQAANEGFPKSTTRKFSWKPKQKSTSESSSSKIARVNHSSHTSNVSGLGIVTSSASASGGFVQTSSSNNAGAAGGPISPGAESVTSAYGTIQQGDSPVHTRAPIPASLFNGSRENDNDSQGHPRRGASWDMTGSASFGGGQAQNQAGAKGLVRKFTKRVKDRAKRESFRHSVSGPSGASGGT